MFFSDFHRFLLSKRYSRPSDALQGMQEAPAPQCSAPIGPHPSISQPKSIINSLKKSDLIQLLD